MTALQSPPSQRSAADIGRDLATRRPLVLTATLGGAFAALGPLVVCLAVALVGWYLTDAGGHGDPSDALGIGALGWLVAHGSGVAIEGIRITAIPLGLTLACAWTVWRIGHRVGESISGHGPDAARIADGERDWTVPVATGLFAAGYVVVATVTCTVVATPATDPQLAGVVGWSLALGVLVGGPAIARGAGRAAIWVAAVPVAVREVLSIARTLLLGWLAISLLAFALALVMDFSTAANVISQLEAGTGETAVIALGCLLLVPNATLFSSSYLLGPGFTVGTGTLVSPGVVVLGPLPLVPLFAALPDTGPQPAWTSLLMITPVLLAAAVTARHCHRHPVSGWDQAAVRGCGGGLLTGAVLGLLTAFAGGSVGPGRMAEVGPFAFDVLLHSVTAFGIGGLLGALAVTCWQQRGERMRGVAGRLRDRVRR